MGSREDYMVMRRAAAWIGRYDAVESAMRQVGVLLARASAREADFIRLYDAGIQAEMIDLAYSVLDEKRPEGPAVLPQEVAE